MAHRVQVGNAEIVSLLDVDHWNLGHFFPHITEANAAVWEAYRPLYTATMCDGFSVCISASSYAIRTGGRTVLVDTGLGPGPHPRANNAMGHLMDDLASAGIRPEEVDTVVCTHLHFDHVGWNAGLVDGAVHPTFPNARYLLPQKDWVHFQQPALADRVGYLQHTLALFDQGRITLVDGEHVVSPDITLLPTPGHTPGHQAVVVQSQGQRAAIIGDAAHTPMQVQETAWSPAADVDPALSARTRAALFDGVEADNALLCAGHFPHPGFGRLVRLADKRLFQAV